MPLVQLLAAYVAAVHLVVKHSLKLALTSRGCCLGGLNTTAANYKLIVGRLVTAVRRDGGRVQRTVALDGGEHVECVSERKHGSG